jgi:hypothetical protein
MGCLRNNPSQWQGRDWLRRRAEALAARRGNAQDPGLHQAARPAEPGEPAREILADAKPEPVFGTKRVTLLEMNKHLAQHLK